MTVRALSVLLIRLMVWAIALSFLLGISEEGWIFTTTILNQPRTLAVYAVILVIVWFLAPYISKYILPGDYLEVEILIGCTGEELLNIGYRLLGAWIVVQGFRKLVELPFIYDPILKIDLHEVLAIAVLNFALGAYLLLAPGGGLKKRLNPHGTVFRRRDD